MKAAAKYVLPVIAGTMTGMFLIFLGERLLQFKYPLSSPVAEGKPSLAAAVAAMPKEAFQLLLVNYAVASFGAGIVATLVAGKTSLVPAVVAGILLTLGGVFNNISIPGQPQWFATISLLLYIPFALFGFLIVRRKEQQSH